MFETRAVIRPTPYALETPLLQRDYGHVWQGLQSRFAPPSSAQAHARSAPQAPEAAERGAGSSGSVLSRGAGRKRVRKRSRR